MTTFLIGWVIVGLVTFTINIIIVKVEKTTATVGDVIIGLILHVTFAPAGAAYICMELAPLAWDAISVPQVIKDFWNKKIL